MNGSPGLRFSGRDAQAQFGVFLLVFGAGCLPIPFMVYRGFGVHAVVTLFAAALLAALGLRFSIVILASGVQITRSWFGIPYWLRRGRAINEVFFGGDWGDAEGACGVVVRLDDREHHIGSGKSMHALHAALLPFVDK